LTYWILVTMWTSAPEYSDATKLKVKLNLGVVVNSISSINRGGGGDLCPMDTFLNQKLACLLSIAAASKFFIYFSSRVWMFQDLLWECQQERPSAEEGGGWCRGRGEDGPPRWRLPVDTVPQRAGWVHRSRCYKAAPGCLVQQPGPQAQEGEDICWMMRTFCIGSFQGLGAKLL